MGDIIAQWCGGYNKRKEMGRVNDFYPYADQENTEHKKNDLRLAKVLVKNKIIQKQRNIRIGMGS